MLVQPVGVSRNKTDGFALFHLGFRPFFLGAAFFAILSMTVWIASYIMPTPLAIESISAMQWHAHEMLYGYSLAVIAGFLLTAVKNWTGLQTLHGKPLLGLFATWAMARLLMLSGTSMIAVAAFFDLLFGLLLMAAVAHPIIKVRQWRQLAILSKLMIMIAGNCLFYLGAMGYMENVVHLSLYGALYLIISLIMLVGRRVIPFFIERGVRETVKLPQYRWLDISILLLFVLFFINELFMRNAELTLFTASLLFVCNGFRLINWHTPGIWQTPLLWGLYLSFWLINAGFLLMAIHYWLSIPSILTVHLFTIGGVGLMSLSMMARVALGHTGRNIGQPPKLITYALAILVLSVLSRVVLPMIDMDHYLWWVTLSSLCWITSFALFLVVYTPILLRPRPDGQPG
jgi:uncharacterized protein involved in response to NO